MTWQLSRSPNERLVYIRCAAETEDKLAHQWRMQLDYELQTVCDFLNSNEKIVNEREMGYWAPVMSLRYCDVDSVFVCK